MTTTTSPSIRLVREGLLKVIRGDTENLPDLSATILRQASTKQKFERVEGLSRLPYAQATPEGLLVNYDQMQTIGFRDYTPINYTLGIQASFQADYNDLYNVLKSKIQKGNLARSMRHTKNRIAANVFNNGFTALADGSNLLVNGQVLFSHSHPLRDGSTFSNRGDGTSDLPLSVNNLEVAKARVRRQLNYDGQPAYVTNSFLLIVPPELEALANRIVGSTQQAQTPNNDINWVGGFFKVMVVQDLVSPTAWFIVPSDKNEHELFMLNGMPLDVALDVDIDTLKTKCVIYEQYCQMAQYWLGTWGTTGA